MENKAGLYRVEHRESGKITFMVQEEIYAWVQQSYGSLAFAHANKEYDISFIAKPTLAQWVLYGKTETS